MKNKPMMATTAVHKLGDISSDIPDLAFIFDEDDENYIGSWAFGFGFADVKFPKSSTRELNPEETEYWKKRRYIMCGHDVGPVL